MSLINFFRSSLVIFSVILSFASASSGYANTNLLAWPKSKIVAVPQEEVETAVREVGIDLSKRTKVDIFLKSTIKDGFRDRVLRPKAKKLCNTAGFSTLVGFKVQTDWSKVDRKITYFPTVFFTAVTCDKKAQGLSFLDKVSSAFSDLI